MKQCSAQGCRASGKVAKWQGYTQHDESHAGGLLQTLLLVLLIGA